MLVDFDTTESKANLRHPQAQVGKYGSIRGAESTPRHGGKSKAGSVRHWRPYVELALLVNLVKRNAGRTTNTPYGVRKIQQNPTVTRDWFVPTFRVDLVVNVDLSVLCFRLKMTRTIPSHSVKLTGGGGLRSSIRTTLESTFGGGRKLLRFTCIPTSSS